MIALTSVELNRSSPFVTLSPRNTALLGLATSARLGPLFSFPGSDALALLQRAVEELGGGAVGADPALPH